MKAMYSLTDAAYTPGLSHAPPPVAPAVQHWGWPIAASVLLHGAIALAALGFMSFMTHMNGLQSRQNQLVSLPQTIRIVSLEHIGWAPEPESSAAPPQTHDQPQRSQPSPKRQSRMPSPTLRVAELRQQPATPAVALAPTVPSTPADTTPAAAQPSPPTPTAQNSSDSAGPTAAQESSAAAAPPQRDATAAESKPTKMAQPDYAHSPPPPYPRAMREQGISGEVWLQVRVQADGYPSTIMLVRSSGYALLDEAALQAVRHWRFHPARKGDQALASWVKFPVRFALES